MMCESSGVTERRKDNKHTGKQTEKQINDESLKKETENQCYCRVLCLLKMYFW